MTCEIRSEDYGGGSVPDSHRLPNFEGSGGVARTSARWQARAALGRAAYALGEDEAAERAWTETASLVQDFATTLSDARRDRFLRAPQVEALLRADVDAPA